MRERRSVIFGRGCFGGLTVPPVFCDEGWRLVASNMRATLSTLRSRDELDAEEAVDGADNEAGGFMCLGDGKGRYKEARKDSRKGREDVECLPRGAALRGEQNKNEEGR